MKDIEGYERERYRLNHVFKSSLRLLWGTSHEKAGVEAGGSAGTGRSLVPLPGRGDGARMRRGAVGKRKVHSPASTALQTQLLAILDFIFNLSISCKRAFCPCHPTEAVLGSQSPLPSGNRRARFCPVS